ncbi:hypothetical protein ACFQ60_06420 [Streptomyces zhihengii]
MDAGDEGRQQLDAVSILNARQTLIGYLGRAGLFAGDAEELVRIVEAGAVALAHEEVGAPGRDAPRDRGEPYAAAGSTAPGPSPASSGSSPRARCGRP